jgi:hypothetical protein
MAKDQKDMTDDDVEHCSHCDEPTGKAGRGDDSLYCTLPDGIERGPLCESCFEMFEKERVNLEKWSVPQ